MDRPRMTREQIAKLVIGQEVQMMCAVYSNSGKVVKITDEEVEVLVPAFTDDKMRQWLSECSHPKEREATLDMNSLKRRTFRFDKDGHETDESVNDRGGGPDPTCGPWDLEQDETMQ